uniref:TRUD domain-containing protein n=1 Tax=Knipowitschia caucasica TaxID=637954 RepID=A0AAV2IU78_KNICA
MTITNQSEIKVKESPDYKELMHLVSEEETDAFFRFTDAKVCGSSYTFLPDDNKEHRTAVHRFLSKRFGKLVETKTFTEQGNPSICVRLREKGNPKKRTAEDCRQEDVYTAFTLCKENLETLEVISFMASELGVLPSDFSYAGIKDKRAITYQSMVVRKVSTDRLKEKASEFERKETLVKAAVENVKCGFVNYYGPQRFGTAQTVQSDQIGLALLKEDMVGALHLFFTPEEGDEPPNKAKRHFLQTGNAKEALLLMPESKARERMMLRALNRFGTGPDGCAQAWLSLPHSSRIFYLHSYCSRVWNEAAAYRLSTLGSRVKQGDLVQEVAGTMDDRNGSNQIHVVTEEEEGNGVFTLGQVHLPMPGNTVKYPENSMGSWYRERLAQDGLENSRFRVNRLKLNVPGCYRPLLANPRNLSYELQRGDICTEPAKLNLTLHFDLLASCYATVYLREVMKLESAPE